MKTWTPQAARWTWPAGETRPQNAYVQFRRSFTLETVPESATVHVTADCRYRLSVNGTILGHGPVTTDPRYKQVDVYDVAAHLRPGENVVAALLQRNTLPYLRARPLRAGCYEITFTE